MHEEDLLIEELKALACKGTFPAPCQSEYQGVTYHVNLPVTQADLADAEKLLGFALPPFLKRVYLEVGNGGFGPGYGLAPLFTPALFPEEEVYFQPSLVHTTLCYRGKDWPETLLYLCGWGCNIYSSIDCSHPQYPIVRSEQTWHIGIEAPSMPQWLRAWLNGTPQFSLDRDNLLPVTFRCS